MKVRSLVVALALLILQTACFAQDAVKDTEAYVASIVSFVEKEGEPHMILADVSDYSQESEPVWKKYETLRDFENAREEEESYTIAYVWRKDGKTVAVSFTYSSPSGDWVHYVYYFFRSDGTAAGVNRELRTFAGDVIVIRKALYDEKGNELKSSKEILDLQTEKPKEPTEDFQDVDVPIYKRVSELPFFPMTGDKEVSGKQ